ncbi:MAG: hypothetical protein ACU85E_11630 [Gammaproteobacteria bacterium]
MTPTGIIRSRLENFSPRWKSCQCPHRTGLVSAKLGDGGQRQAATLDGNYVDYHNAPLHWGGPGTNGQRSYFLLPLQGTSLILCDFIGFNKSLNPLGGRPTRSVDNQLHRPD